MNMDVMMSGGNWRGDEEEKMNSRVFLGEDSKCSCSEKAHQILTNRKF